MLVRDLSIFLLLYRNRTTCIHAQCKHTQAGWRSVAGSWLPVPTPSARSCFGEVPCGRAQRIFHTVKLSKSSRALEMDLASYIGQLSAESIRRCLLPSTLLLHWPLPFCNDAHVHRYLSTMPNTPGLHHKTMHTSKLFEGLCFCS